MHDAKKYHPTERFSNRAKHYSQARPDYPRAALDFLREHCHLTESSKVCDIGAGTGISTRAFAGLGVHVVGVEPNEAMLTEAREHPDFSDRIEYVKAPAEGTGLADESFDLIVCAQAFHWFDPDKALTEFHRILKKGGWVALIWNERDESDAFTKRYGDLLRSWPDTSKVEMKRGKAGEPLLESPMFNNRKRYSFLHSHEMTLDKLIGRALSASYAPAPDSPEAESFSEKLRELFAEFAKNDLVVMKYESSVYTGQK